MHNLAKLRKFIGLTQKQLAEILSVGQNTISLIETGVISLTERNKQRLVERLHINLKWLSLGEGEMFCTEEAALAQLPDNLTQLIRRNTTISAGVPFYNRPITNSTTSFYSDMVELQPDYRIDIRPFNDCTFFRPIFGDSMLPRLHSGDIVACMKVNISDVILFGETYLCVLPSNEGYIELIRIIRRHEDSDKIILKPLNDNFDMMVISLSDISNLYLIKCSIMRFI